MVGVAASEDDVRKLIRQGDEVKALARKLKRRPTKQPAAGAGLWSANSSASAGSTGSPSSAKNASSKHKAAVLSPKEGQTLLNTALRYDRLQIAEYLINKQAASVSGNSLAMALSADMVDILVKAGADVNQPNPLVGGTTPLHSAQNTKVLVALLRNGADPTRPDTSGNTPLHLFAFTGKQRMMEVLLLHNSRSTHGRVNVDARNNMGLTPLHCAVERGFVDCARALKEAGANLRLVTPEGQSAASMAASLRQTKSNTDWSFLTQKRQTKTLLSRALSVPAIPALPDEDEEDNDEDNSNAKNHRNAAKRAQSVVATNKDFWNMANTSLDESKLVTFGGGRTGQRARAGSAVSMPSSRPTATKQVSFKVPHKPNEKIEGGTKDDDVEHRQDRSTVPPLLPETLLPRSSSVKRRSNSLNAAATNKNDKERLLASHFNSRDSSSSSLLPDNNDGADAGAQGTFAKAPSNRSLSSLSDQSVKTPSAVETFRETAIKASRAVRQARATRQTSVGSSDKTSIKLKNKVTHTLEGLEHVSSKTDNTMDVSSQASVSSTGNMTESSTEFALSLSIPNRIHRLEDLLDCHSDTTDSCFIERLRSLEMALTGQATENGGVLKRLTDLEKVVFGR